MMRGKPGSSMQKTYDDCYLICSTAIYFENQNNEPEALRSWKNALDQIYYFNAYRLPANYKPKTETEKALQESLKELELQCKERVDILEALKMSRVEAEKDKAAGASDGAVASPPAASPKPDEARGTPGWMGGGTIAPVGYPQLARPPALLQRPSFQSKNSSSGEASRAQSHPQIAPLPDPPALAPSPAPEPQQKKSRTPSPNKKGGMLRTLRPGRGPDSRKDAASSRSSQRPPRLPTGAAKAASQAWTGPSHGSVDSLTAATTKLSVSAASATLALPRHSLDDPSSLSRAQSQPDFSGRPVAEDSSSKAASSTLKASLPDVESASGPPKPLSKPAPIPYRKEYPRVIDPHTRRIMPEALRRSARDVDTAEDEAGTVSPSSPDSAQQTRSNQKVRRKEVARKPAPKQRSKASAVPEPSLTDSFDEDTTSPDNPRDTPSNSDDESDETTLTPSQSRLWKQRCDRALRRLGKGVDKAAAQQILNEIVIQGDEVHWDDIAGLETAKGALKETVVYPFLRPDLFMGLREPARGMLLFGPPGTGKTMLARAVATESRSTFFAISASSLTSKFLGESEKLVRALFALARALAPSIIFVDEIDSLLAARGGSGEHEATRRIKTEFLVQWSDLQRAAAGRDATGGRDRDGDGDRDGDKGDATRVLVLAATNMPWAIDEAARRRFVRRQYIPLPEGVVRAVQLRTLLSHQKHDLSDGDIDELVRLTDGFSGSDITALAKDAAMGPLRSLGERLLHMSMDEIRPISFLDFQASLASIRPSVSRQGLKQYEDWARDFGERGG